MAGGKLGLIVIITKYISARAAAPMAATMGLGFEK